MIEFKCFLKKRNVLLMKVGHIFYLIIRAYLIDTKLAIVQVLCLCYFCKTAN